MHDAMHQARNILVLALCTCQTNVLSQGIGRNLIPDAACITLHHFGTFLARFYEQIHTLLRTQMRLKMKN